MRVKSRQVVYEESSGSSFSIIISSSSELWSLWATARSSKGLGAT